ncbi:MAG: hypothetical protein Q4G43_02845 [Mobilicoccus sp.]|nr:hypothetical protein [Mobilicoccus sp.]
MAAVAGTWLISPEELGHVPETSPTIDGLTEATPEQVAALREAALAAPNLDLGATGSWYALTQNVGIEVTEDGLGQPVTASTRESWAREERGSFRLRPQHSETGGLVATTSDNGTRLGSSSSSDLPTDPAAIPTWLEQRSMVAADSTAEAFSWAAGALTSAVTAEQRASLVTYLTGLDGVRVFHGADMLGREGLVIHRTPDATSPGGAISEAVILRESDAAPLEVWSRADNSAAAGAPLWSTILRLGVSDTPPVGPTGEGHDPAEYILPSWGVPAPSVDGLTAMDTDAAVAAVREAPAPPRPAKGEYREEIRLGCTVVELPGGGCEGPVVSWSDKDGQNWQSDDGNVARSFGTWSREEVTASMPPGADGLSDWVDATASHPVPDPLTDEGRFSHVATALALGYPTPEQREALARYAVDDLGAEIFADATDQLGRPGILLHRTVEGGDVTDGETQALLLAPDGTPRELWFADIADPSKPAVASSWQVWATMTIVADRIVTQMPTTVED